MTRAGKSHVTAAALILAAVAGYVDALGFQLLRGVFTSHVTGDSAHMATYAANANWAEAARFGWPVLTLVAGFFISAFITAIGKKRGFHSTFGIALAIEALLLFFSPLVTAFHPLTAMLTVAMGIQTLTVTRIPGLRVYTTYMTGNLAKFAEGATQFFINGNRAELRHSTVTGLLWALFTGGVITGTVAHGAWDRTAAAPPAIVIAAVAALDFRRPIDPADELQD